MVAHPIRLISVYAYSGATGILLDLLKEREPHVNISHRKMPTWDEHCKFIRSDPYQAWYIIENDEDKPVGSIYLSKQNEIGIFIFMAHQGKGYGSQAIELLMQKHKCESYLANINPENNRSIELFRRLGFKHIQNTYESQR